MSDINIICTSFQKKYDEEKGGRLVAKIVVENLTEDEIIIDNCVVATKPIKLGSVSIHDVKVLDYYVRLKPHDERIRYSRDDEWYYLKDYSISIPVKVRRVSELYKRLKWAWDYGDGNWGPPTEDMKYEVIALPPIKIRLHGVD